jgi:hypothetical protein
MKLKRPSLFRHSVWPAAALCVCGLAVSLLPIVPAFAGFQLGNDGTSSKLDIQWKVRQPTQSAPTLLRRESTLSARTLANPEDTLAAALDSLNRFLEDDIYPAELEQAHGLNQRTFLEWLSQSGRGAEEQKRILQLLKPAMARSDWSAVLLQDVTSKRRPGLQIDMVLVGIPAAIATRVLGSDVVVIASEDDDEEEEEDENQQVKCQYHKCYRQNPDAAGICVTATRFTEECPDDQCASDSDCGGGGGQIIDAIGLF